MALFAIILFQLSEALFFALLSSFVAWFSNFIISAIISTVTMLLSTFILRIASIFHFFSCRHDRPSYHLLSALLSLPYHFLITFLSKDPFFLFHFLPIIVYHY